MKLFGSVWGKRSNATVSSCWQRTKVILGSERMPYSTTESSSQSDTYAEKSILNMVAKLILGIGRISIKKLSGTESGVACTALLTKVNFFYATVSFIIEYNIDKTIRKKKQFKKKPGAQTWRLNKKVQVAVARDERIVFESNGGNQTPLTYSRSLKNILQN